MGKAMVEASKVLVVTRTSGALEHALPVHALGEMTEGVELLVDLREGEGRRREGKSYSEEVMHVTEGGETLEGNRDGGLGPLNIGDVVHVLVDLKGVKGDQGRGRESGTNVLEDEMVLLLGGVEEHELAHELGGVRLGLVVVVVDQGLVVCRDEEQGGREKRTRRTHCRPWPCGSRRAFQ